MENQEPLVIPHIARVLKVTIFEDTSHAQHNIPLSSSFRVMFFTYPP